MSTGIINIIKKAALDAVENSQVCDIRYGEVISISPLKVKVTNQMILPQAVLVIPEHLTNHTVEVTVDSDTKTITINNALKIGDKIALLRKHGGQSYFILDRI